MAVKKAIKYLDTIASGLIIIFEHNLNGTPYTPTLYELDAGKKVYVSIFDPRISEIKTLDDNNIQFTFASTFQGYAELFLSTAEEPTDHDRIIALEEKYLEQFDLIEAKVSKDQWIQMNTLFESQVSSLQDQIDALQSQVNLLSSDVEAL